MIAFFPSLSWTEMFLLMVAGLLLYGRNLPEAGRSMGRLMAQLRRGFQEFKDQLDRDGDLRDVKKTLQDTKQELRRVAQVPRAMANPGAAVRDFATEAMTSSPPDEPDEPSPPMDDETEPSSPTPSTRTTETETK